MNVKRLARRATGVVVTAGVLALAACTAAPGSSSTGDAGEMTTLKVATIGLISDGALLVGQEQGFFEDEGIVLETSVVANPPAGLAAAQSGQVDVAYAPSIPLLNALSSGVPLTVIAPADGYVDGAAEAEDPAAVDDTGLYASAASGITSVADLEGATIAIPARKAQLEVVISDALDREGIDPGSVEWVVLDFTSAVAALTSGTVDAAGLVSPFTGEADAAGAVFVSAPSVDFFEEGAVGLWTAGDGTISAKGDAIAAFQRAVAKSNAYANEHPEEAIQAGIDATGSTLGVDDVKLPFWPAEVAPVDLERVDDKLVALGFLPTPVDLEGVVLAAE
ncbi:MULTISPECIES: ABC transporter substrate-binding protein [unclassified Microbacterium]|uniref:ABC transporter substrate-binding protein n=1 Tax=unclassified Microbacterium TaxID=2609290 RepID=UPI0016050677|nr:MULTISPECIES: ABC transporter substrate-binding protein [unclassified Microbacterium]QNA92121.1 ABC transporter substrate-binding protein [Microbacterium sp. Se63.02b]QYM65373.1 ABC transporter substrate-binding protein [Microbacterium sp. Se5.02b]